MVTDNQVRLLMKLKPNNSISVAAVKSGMSENTARKYINSGVLKSM